MFPISWIIQARLADVATVVDENVNGVRVVKSFAQEEAEVNRLADAAERVAWAYVKDADIRGVVLPVGPEPPPARASRWCSFFGGWMVINGHLGIGAILAFNVYLGMLQAPFMMLGQLVMMGQRAKASAERIFEILDESPEVAERPGAVDLDRRDAAASTFRHVGFTYGDGAARSSTTSTCTSSPARPSPSSGGPGRASRRSRGCSRASTTSPTGPSSIDGHDVRDLTLSSLRARVGVVHDEPFLFSVSIRDNIAYGRPDATDDEVEAAARAANAHEFIARAPRGLRHRRRRAGLHALGRPAPAHRHRAHPAAQPADPGPRRRDQLDRRARRARDPRGAARPARAPHDARDRPPPLDHRARRPRVLLDGGPRRRDRAPTQQLLATAPLYAEVLAQTRPRGGPTDGAGAAAGAAAGPGAAAGGPASAQRSGLPFGGIPSELMAEATQDPRRPSRRTSRPTLGFTQRPSERERRRLTLCQLLVGDLPALARRRVGAGDRHRASSCRPGPAHRATRSTTGWSPDTAASSVDRGRAPASTSSWRFVSVALQRGGVHVTGRLAARVMHDLRIRVFTHFQRLSLDFFTEEKAGVLMSRMTSDIENLQQLVQDGISQFALQGLDDGGHHRRALRDQRRARHVDRRCSSCRCSSCSRSGSTTPRERGYLLSRDRIANVLADLSESLYGIRVVTANNRQRHNIVNHRHVVGDYRDANLYTGRVNAIYGPATLAIGILGQALLLGIGGDDGAPPPAAPSARWSPSSSTSTASSSRSSCSSSSTTRSSRAARRSSGCASCSRRRRASTSAATRPTLAAARGPHHLRARQLRLRRRAAGAHRRRPRDRPGRVGRVRRADRRRQVDDGQARQPLLRPPRRVACCSTASTCAT